MQHTKRQYDNEHSTTIHSTILLWLYWILISYISPEEQLSLLYLFCYFASTCIWLFWHSLLGHWCWTASTKGANTFSWVVQWWINNWLGQWVISTGWSQCFKFPSMLWHWQSRYKKTSSSLQNTCANCPHRFTSGTGKGKKPTGQLANTGSPEKWPLKG